MAFRLMLSRGIMEFGGRNFNSRTFASTPSSVNHHCPHYKQPNSRGGSGASVRRGELAPLYVMLGMVLVAVGIGASTAKQQLAHSPAVQASKTKRECVPEVEHPGRVVDSADKFITGSFLRKVAHIQDQDRADPFTRSRRGETVESVGVEPGRH